MGKYEIWLDFSREEWLWEIVLRRFFNKVILNKLS